MKTVAVISSYRDWESLSPFIQRLLAEGHRVMLIMADADYHSGAHDLAASLGRPKNLRVHWMHLPHGFAAKDIEWMAI